MKFVVITKDPLIERAAREGFQPGDDFALYQDWREALEHADGADLMFVDLVSTLEQAHKIAGYEEFALAKMDHITAAGVPLILISPPLSYELDFMTGWPDFVFAHIRQPVEPRHFRRASTWL